GSTPLYQWKKNTIAISGETNATYITSTLANNDAITVVLTSNISPCPTGNPATSNTITMTVNANQPVSVSISSDDADNTICQNTTVTFTATPTNGGTSPLYQWNKNTIAINGETNATYITSTLTNNEPITAVLTSKISTSPT